MIHAILGLFIRISNAFGIKWAPLDLPMQRRLQTLGALAWVIITLCGEPLCILAFFKLIYSAYWWLGILYAVWMINDIEVCHRGGRKIEWVRNWKLWSYYADYFPIQLRKTSELDPDKNYLLAVFPHGVVSSGIMGAFASNSRHVNKIFPGMSFNFITLAGHFSVPFFRDFILSLGGCSSSQESLLYLLDKKKRKGNGVILMVGGAAEALNSHPGEYTVVLKRRKGFIRVAMKSGAPLVPVFSFGEPDVYRPLDNPQDSWTRKIQEKVREITGISPIFLIGRGIFQYSFGILPMRAPINVVVGAPMEVERNLDPTDEEVNAVHAQFTEKLIQLFESEKSKYLQNHENTELIIT
ncbi:2-acylglycerol O-acyltransferase 2-A-like isoform X1 [Aricia agestis]|uniref:2-acylglycerol O-acyltransferase 2-A-like isoform X1 n=1 Tax=Aricia agestis TaxID=91739 RepID=UPI001C202AE4|nr:2-acylglycerol O-acyltransferase 2-A-like isoform X1 [Aricia agestis]